MDRSTLEKVNRIMVDGADDIRRDISNMAAARPWLSWFPVKEWSVGLGDTIHLHQFGAAQSVEGELQSGGEFRKTERTYSLKRALVRSNPIDVRKRGEIDAEVDKFRLKVLYGWERHIRNSYADLAAVRAVDDVALTSSQPFPVVLPPPLNRDWLVWAHNHLRDRGALMPSASVVSDEDTQIPVEAGLIKAIDPRPRRWKIVDGEWVEVLPYFTVDGGDLPENPEYKDAKIQDYPILVHGVMSLLVPKLYQDKEFNDRLWTGSVGWVNIFDSETNPDGFIGRYMSQLCAAVRPIKTDLAIIIRAQRP